jgi:tetratricopeptide (TPR) repeat protein
MLTDLYSRRADMHDWASALCCFAYAKMCEDTGDDETAFAAYAESNRIKAALLPFDEAREEAQTAAILRLFDRNFIAAHHQAAAPSAGLPTPIFIVSMPCAGAGWLERMLAQHPLAGAAHVDFGDLLADAAQPFPDLAATLDAAAWRTLGERYLQLTARQAPGKTFVIDRNPENVRYLGLIHLALPQARIVHVMRDPLDSCFSLYASNAEPDIAYSHDLSLLGRQYVRYIHLMRHWHAALPPRTIEDVHYEDLVRETRQQTRRVVAFAGLPWSDRCLQPPPRIKNQHTHLSARWHSFAQHLEPLYASIKRYRQADGAGNLLAEALHSTLLSRAIQLYAEDRFAEALTHYDQALAIRPNDALALVNKGIVLRDLRRPDESITCFNKALAIAPEMAIAQYNLGAAQLKTGDWQAGWENYETRWRGNDQAQKGALKPPPALRPQWNGEADTKHQNLLVFTEQGIGDSLQFVRYLSLAKQRFAKVGFVCPMPLLRLMEWSFGDDIILLATEPKAANLWDKQSPLMSLPRAFQTRPDTVPADVPYLHVPAVAKNYWQARLAAWPTRPRLRVGIAWTGNKNYLYDKRRSLTFEQLQTLWPIADVTWVNLQVRMPKDAPPPMPKSVDWIDWTMELADFADTAALVANLDLVISIDSAIAHLAGALGRPTWLLNRFESEWRWLLNREDSPWYPTMRIFNQPSFGDWESVLQSIAAALQALAKHNPEHGR